MARGQRHQTQTACCALALALAAPASADPAAAQGEVVELHMDQAHGKATEGITKDSDPATGRVGSSLLALYQEYRAHQELRRTGLIGDGPAFRPSDGLARVQDGYVEIEAIAASDGGGLVTALEEMGMHDSRVLGRLVSGQFPIAQIQGLADIPSLQFAHPSYAVTNVGSVTTQGDRAILADAARTAVGVTGSGVTVGVISDSYNCLNGAGAAKDAGDLPRAIDVIESPEQDHRCGIKDDDEGRAMMEIIHDVAPEAGLAFHTFRGGQVAFADAVRTLAAAGADVIVDDTTNLAEPMFQDGVVAQAVDEVTSNGVAFFSSAGNDARSSYESAFNASATSFSYGKGACAAHNFASGDVRQTIKLPPDREVRLVFQWDEPFASVSGAPGSASDMDILVMKLGTTEVIAKGTAVNTGGDPVEVVTFTNNTSAERFELGITRCGGPDPTLMKYVLIGSGTILEHDNAKSTVYGHANARGAETTGAAWYRKTPEFGTSPPQIEHFSAVGGTPILFDILGNRIAAETRQKPAIVAPDGVDTRFFGANDPDGTNRPNFFGTSAAAAHAAGVAALMLEANPNLAPAQLYAVLEEGAIDMNDPGTPGFDAGFDFASGFGLIQADASVGAVARQANLSITATGTPNPVTVGQNLTYTLTIANQGPETADGVTVTDLLPATVVPVSATASQGSCAGGATVNCALGNVASGANATVTVVAAPQTRGLIRNVASVTANQRDLDVANNRAELFTTVNPLPGLSDLSITMTDSPDPVPGGGTLTYTMTVTNHGPDEVGGVAVTDPIPGGATLVSSGPSQGACVGTTEVTCNLGTLAIGAGATVTVRVGAPGHGSISNTASVAGNKADPDPGNDSTTELTGVDVPLCNDRRATMVGTEGNDFLFGTPGNDVIVGLAGNDRIDGRGGNDTICGGNGFDRLLGSGGKDWIDGGSDADRMSGGRGRDRLIGGTGNDTLMGNQGRDVLKGGRGRDRLDGGPGTDVCKGRHERRCER
ncbi:MAG: S8 family serine peptidase [Gammaproteobacteria bacterium]